MEFKKSKVFDILQSYPFLDNEGRVEVSKTCVEIYDNDNDLLATYWFINGKLRVEFTDNRCYTSEELEDYLGLLVDLKECLVK
jgi:hypothetical protein